MRILSGIFFIFFVLSGISAQEVSSIITPYDSVMLMKLPRLERTPTLKSADLPYAVDNSKLPYFRPIYEQVASECSQVSAIAYNFTYEMNRLRDLPSTDTVNQYPTHFVYNFDNRGSPWYGVSYIHSFEILKTLGTPDVPTYGGMAAGGAHRWMDGYDNYLAAMSNRIHEAYQIPVGTEEGLMQLKQWLHNHLEGSAYGGVASFYANAPWNMKLLPSGTPEAGKKVIVDWGGLPTHAMAIVGYNDSIRWDYNWDMQYTNHIDINEDGIVDMKDWEIGGLIFADGWDGGINHGDSGKCYMMYRTLANLVYEGGIWNNVVHVVEAIEQHEPELTAKIRLNHNRRNAIKVSIGVASSLTDTLPEYIMDFPIFNFQGGEQYMQGGTDIEENKNIEFGLDISPMLGLLEKEDSNIFFLVVEERDPDSLAGGYIREFTVIDYSGVMPVEHTAIYDTVPIRHNRLTYIPLVINTELDIMKITTGELPEAIIDEPYYFEMECMGGSLPVRWEIVQAIKETETEGDTDTTGTFTEPGHWMYGNIPCELPFPFNFYGKEYDSIYIHPAGFIMFENTTNPWPYLVDPEFFVRNNRCIAPLLCKYFEFIPAFGQGIWVDKQNDHISITWISHCDYPGYMGIFEFALELHADGNIKFIYGSDFEGYKFPWTCGISEGDGYSFYFPELADRHLVTKGEAVSLDLIALPEGMTFNEDGTLSGVPRTFYDGELMFCAEDYDHKRSFRSLHFNASGLGINECGDKISFHVYPNPGSGVIHLRYATPDTRNLKLELYSIDGRRLKVLYEGCVQTGGHEFEYDLTDLPEGLYLLYIRMHDQQITKKLILTSP